MSSRTLNKTKREHGWRCMAAPAQQHQPSVGFDPFHEHRTSETPSITISPATSNKNLRFSGYTGVTTSLRSAFEGHRSFKAAFQVPVDCVGRIAFEEFDEEYNRPGRIVALSEKCSMDMTTEDPKADRNEFELKGAKQGLVSAIMTAYNRHCNLMIGPDDVWLTILAQFCAYVNRNAESLRGRIVEHEGKKELKVYSYGTLETTGYGAMVRDLLGKIRENIKSPELADWFRPGFSTTTEKDEVCAAATALASLQSYFDYRLMRMRCGIPTVTLMGTVEDWELLREKVDRLLEFEIQNNPDGNVMRLWVGYLRKVCDGFVESAENPDSSKTLEFWDKVLLHRGGGSGPSYITGWLSAFTCFATDGKFIGTKREVEEFVRVADADSTRHESQTVVTEFPLINTDKICHNVVSCPVKINDDGVEFEGALVAGQVVFEVEQVKKDAYPTIRPRNDWCMTVAVK